MDEKTNNEIEKYMSNLPENVLGVVNDKTWPKRVDEISEKYSLTDEQKSTLQDIVLFVIVGIESPETFGASLETELGISKLLVEQILADLDTRVFQYAFDFVNKQSETNKPNAAKTAPDATNVPVRKPFDVLNGQKKEVEIAPVILPRIESEEERKKVMEQNRIAETRPNTVPPASTPTASQKNMGNIPNNLPGMPVVETVKTSEPTKNIAGQTQEGTFIGSEFIQKPIAVPRFGLAQNPPKMMSEQGEVTAPKPQNIIDAKLNSVVSTNQAQTDKKPEVQYPPRYTTDPYREPLE